MRLFVNKFIFSEMDFLSGYGSKPLSDDIYRKELESILSHDKELLKAMDSYIGMMQLSRIWYVSGCHLGSISVPEQFSMFENANWLPVIYCFRHALELAFKAYLFAYKKHTKDNQEDKEHNLKKLYGFGVDELFKDYFNLCNGKRGNETDVNKFVTYFSNMDKGENQYRYYMEGNNKLMHCNMNVLYIQRMIDYLLQVIEVYVLFDIFMHYHNIFPALCFSSKNEYGANFYFILNQGFGYGQSDNYNKCIFKVLFGCSNKIIDDRYEESGK